jgi:hypothetical protein
MRTRSLLLLFLALPVSAQRFQFGLKAGVRLTDDAGDAITPQSRRYVVGPMVTAQLPLSLRLEFDALYRRVGGFTQYGTIHFFFIQQERGNSWEFPVLVRRSLWRGVYGSLGVAPRVIGGAANVISYGCVPVNYDEFDAPASWQNSVGLVAAAGIERRIGPLRIAPEIRYTHWNRPQNSIFGGNQDQADLLLGATFP